LSRYRILRELNFRLERFLRGGRREYVDCKGLRFFLDPRGSLSQPFHEYEPETTSFIEKNLKNGDFFVDVGASIGWFTLIASRIVGKGGVIAVEPNPVEAALLRKNVEYNACTNVEVIERAAGNTRERRILYVVSDMHTGGSLEDPRIDPRRDPSAHLLDSEDHTVYEYPVEVIPLDAVVSRASMIKIDVEGAEFEVVKGMSQVLRQYRPIVILEHPSPKTRRLIGSLGYKEKFFFDKLNTVFFAS